MSHPWLSPSGLVVADLTGKRAMEALRQLATIPASRLGPYASARPHLVAALPALLRMDSERVLGVVGRIDVLPVLLELATGRVDPGRIERALLTLWLGIAGHPGLVSPLALPGPFRERAVDPHAPRVIALGSVRGLAATARGPIVIGRQGQLPIEQFAVSSLPTVDGTVIVDERLTPPDGEVTARVRAALALVGTALPGGRLERVTLGPGDAASGEARVGRDVDPANLVASAQAAFIRTAAAVEPLLDRFGMLIEKGHRLAPVEVLARACGNAVALPWRAERSVAAAAVLEDLDDIAVLADLTPAGEGLVAAIRALAGPASRQPRRALLVNVDADDFVYSFQFGQSIERRCVQRNLRVDRVAIDGTAGRDLAGELGCPVPVGVADGVEFLVASDNDPALIRAVRRLAARSYDVVIANVRPRLFYDLVETDLLTGPTLVWDRHLHDGLTEERARRGSVATRAPQLPIRLWSLLGGSGSEVERGNAALIDAGLDRVTPRPWPMDLNFFRSAVTANPNRLFAGGDSGRDWPLFVEAVRDLPYDVHLVSAQAPTNLPPNIRVEARLSLWRFRDAMAAAAVTAIPLLPGGGASGLTVLTIAMALGVAVVATASPWIGHYVTDGQEVLLVPPGDVHAFRKALVSLFERPDLRARLVANARRRIAALCDLEAFTRDMFATLG